MQKQSFQFEQIFFSKVLAEAPFMVIELDETLRLKTCNLSFEQTSLQKLQDLKSQHISQIMPELDVTALEMVLDTASSYHLRQEHITRIGTKYFNELFLNIYAWSIENSDIRHTELIVIFTDVSETVKLSKQRDELIAALAHDIKNPLTGELKVLEGIIKGVLGEVDHNAKEALKSIAKSNSSLLLLLSNMIEVYKTENTASAIYFQKIDLSVFLKDVLSELKYLVAGTKIAIEYVEIEGGVCISGDETALRRVIQNLVYNATKYAYDHSSIQVSLSIDDMNNSIIRVFNQGPQISEEEKAGLFERFTIGEQGKRTLHSSGLGLYLCKKIIEEHSGIIGCTSNNKGTSFIISIPSIQESNGISSI